MNPTCRRLMRYRTPCLMLCRYCVTDLRYPHKAPGLKGRHPSEKGCRSDKRSNHRCYEGQTQTGGNGSAHARASAALTCAMPQCMAQRYCVTLGMPQLAVDTGGRPHKALIWLALQKCNRLCENSIACSRHDMFCCQKAAESMNVLIPPHVRKWPCHSSTGFSHSPA